jgi:hypothetical protein
MLIVALAEAMVRGTRTETNIATMGRGGVLGLTSGGTRALPLDFSQHGPHADGEGLDFSEAGECFRIDLGFVQQEELGLGEKSGQGVRQVMAQPA